MDPQKNDDNINGFLDHEDMDEIALEECTDNECLELGKILLELYKPCKWYFISSWNHCLNFAALYNTPSYTNADVKDFSCIHVLVKFIVVSELFTAWLGLKKQGFLR